MGRFRSLHGRVVLALVAGLILAGGAVPVMAWGAAAAPPARAGTAAAVPVHSAQLWSKPKPIPASAALKVGTTVDPTSIDCVGSGECAAIGTATPVNTAFSAVDSEPFVVSESNGKWQEPHQLTGFAGLAGQGDPVVPDAVSCASPGNCVAGGDYTPGGSVPAHHEPFRPFLAVEKNGKWGAAQTVPGIAQLNTENDGDITSVSCTRPGYCTAAGFYGIPFPHGEDATLTRPFTVDEIGGKWQKARPVPVPKGASSSMFDAFNVALSCGSPGSCTVGFAGGTSAISTFVLNETRFKWSGEQRVKGMSTFSAIDCTTAGNCAMVGGNMVAKSTGGVWSAATKAGGTTLNLTVLSCGSKGNCLAGGSMANAAYTSQRALVVPERNGKWGPVSNLSDVNAKSSGGSASIGTLSCDAAQQCEVGGSYTVGTMSGTSNGFTEELDRSVQAPPQTFKAGGVGLISCTSAGSCGGLVQGAPVNAAAAPTSSYAYFTQKLLVKTTTALGLSTAKVTYGKEKSEKVSVSVGPAAPVTPTGKVRVTSGKTTLCTITLKSARGSCFLSAKQLKPGSYSVVATYLGDVNRKSSVSPGRKLSVLK